MLSWYAEHVYVLPWWAYAAALYLLIGLFAMRLARIFGEPDPSAFILGWPLFGLAYLAVWGAVGAGWLLGFRETPPPLPD